MCSVVPSRTLHHTRVNSPLPFTHPSPPPPPNPPPRPSLFHRAYQNSQAALKERMEQLISALPLRHHDGETGTDFVYHLPRSLLRRFSGAGCFGEPAAGTPRYHSLIASFQDRTRHSTALDIDEHPGGAAAAAPSSAAAGSAPDEGAEDATLRLPPMGDALLE